MDRAHLKRWLQRLLFWRKSPLEHDLNYVTISPKTVLPVRERGTEREPGKKTA